MKRAVLVPLLLAALGSPASAEEATLAPVPALDLQRYAGVWYEIARLPFRFQEKCAHSVVVRYTVRDDGRLGVVNECVEKDGRLSRASGVARLADPKGPPSRLKVRFAPAFLSPADRAARASRARPLTAWAVRFLTPRRPRA
jgi:apolipoprotein D and lipocalin family protein